MQHEGADASARAHAIFAVAHSLAFATCVASATCASSIS